jgi:hypothetical protein
MPKKRIKKSKDSDIRITKKRTWSCSPGYKCGGCGFWGFGSALAMILSYSQNSSILWAILHGIISWIYVIYRIFI